MKADQIKQYAEAHFNLVMGSCVIGCEGPGPDPSGPPGSPEAALDCVSRAARDLDALGLKLAEQPHEWISQCPGWLPAYNLQRQP